MARSSTFCAGYDGGGNQWIRYFGPVDPRLPLLICVPYAGGAASVYRDWSGRLPEVNLAAVQLPARENRIHEPPLESAEEVARALAGALTATDQLWPQAPFALFGHSMGAAIAFELVRQLEALGAPDPFELFVAGANAPSVPILERYADLPDAELIATLRRFAHPDDGDVDTELLIFMLPTIRADLRIAESYVRQAETVVAAPITALYSTGDQLVDSAGVLAWEQHGCSSFRAVRFGGGHFFPFGAERRVTDFLATAIASRNRSARRTAAECLAKPE
jgi:surfactin synthase thioesterase subunit